MYIKLVPLHASSLFWNVTQHELLLSYQHLFLDSLTLEDGTDRLSGNIGKQLPGYAAYYSRTGKILLGKGKAVVP
jgi:hypothetical protein